MERDAAIVASKPYIVNAFTADGRNGNPAGVVLDADNLDAHTMLRIAAGVGLSETAFISHSARATKRVRFFTPIVEEPLCGHATIASWSLLRDLGIVTPGSYTQETKAGILQVDVTNELVFMEQTKASFYETILPAEIAPLLGLTTVDFTDRLKPQIISTGIKDLLIPVKDKSVLGKIQPHLAGIAAFSKHHGISGFHVFTLLNDSESLASARNFAPADGIPEESATGTSNGALLCYLHKQGLLPQQEIYRIEQGEATGKLSHIYGTFKDDIVWVGGSAKQQSE